MEGVSASIGVWLEAGEDPVTSRASGHPVGR
jgi:hypothetical protein